EDRFPRMRLQNCQAEQQLQRRADQDRPQRKSPPLNREQPGHADEDRVADEGAKLLRHVTLAPAPAGLRPAAGPESAPSTAPRAGPVPPPPPPRRVPRPPPQPRRVGPRPPPPPAGCRPDNHVIRHRRQRWHRLERPPPRVELKAGNYHRLAGPHHPPHRLNQR